MIKIYPADVQDNGSVVCISPKQRATGSTVNVQYQGTEGEAVVYQVEPVDSGVLGYRLYLDVNWASFTTVVDG